MNNTSKNRKPGPSSEVTSVPFVDEAKLLLARCLVSLNAIDGPYFYEVIGTASIPGSLSHVLCVTEEQLMTIYRCCGFYIVKNQEPDTTSTTDTSPPSINATIATSSILNISTMC